MKTRTIGAALAAALLITATVSAQRARVFITERLARAQIYGTPFCLRRPSFRGLAVVIRQARPRHARRRPAFTL